MFVVIIYIMECRSSGHIYKKSIENDKNQVNYSQ